MLVCVTCNVEFKEDRKFCSYCGGPLVTKEDLVPDKKGPEKDEEESGQKLICPNCKISYEFGSSCIQCGSGLVSEIPPKGKELPEVDHKRREDKREPLPPIEPRQKQTGKSREDLICPTCNITYENGNFCPKCGSPLLPQKLTQALEEAKAVFKPRAGGESTRPQTIQERLVAAPRKNLICPRCKIIYEHGSSCVRCGSALVGEVTPIEVAPAEPPSTLDHAFDPSTRHKTSTHPAQTSEPKIPFPSSPKKPDLDLVLDGLEEPRVREGIKQIVEVRLREEVEFFPGEETDKALGASNQDPATDADTLERRSIHPRKHKIDYHRLFLEVGGVSLMALAGGYLLWSIYSHVARLPEPKASRLPPSTSSKPLAATATIAAPQESTRGEAEQRSVMPKEKSEVASPPPSGSISSDSLVLETMEIGKIKDLLENIQLANLRKDIDLFVSCYTTDFKGRDGKKKATLSFWKKFDYLELSYDLKRASITGDTASIRIEWVMKILPKGGGNPQESKTFSEAMLKKEEGKWKIQEVKQAD